MIPWANCCCDEDDPFFFFVPCPGTDSCAEGFFALKSQWTVILGEVPVVDDVWKYNDPERVEPCDFCGKFQTEFPDTLGSFAPSSGFEKQDDCNDPDCPLPLLFFVPCDDGVCGAYTMAALVSEWETLLSLSTGTIDLSDPTTYAGTWLFERTDGFECCEDDPSTNQPALKNCFKFCGNLSLSGSTDLCFDDSTKPLAEQCLKCDVPDGKVQRINMANQSGLSFVLQENCDDDDCPKPCDKQIAASGSYIRVDGTTIYSLKHTVSSNLDFTRTVTGPTCEIRTAGGGETRLEFTVKIEYSYYLEVNAVSRNIEDLTSLPEWRKVLAGHCKDQCAVVRSATFIGTNELFADWRYDATILSGSPSCEGSFEEYDFAGSFAFNTEPTQVLEFAKLEKRKGLFGHAALPECDPTSSPSTGYEFPDHNLRICPDLYETDDCISSWMHKGNLPLRLSGTGTTDDNFDGPQSWNITNSQIPAAFPALTSASAALDDACCPTDAFLDGDPQMYFTQGVNIQSVLTHGFSQMNAGQFTSAVSLGIPSDPYGPLKGSAPDPGSPGTMDLTSLFGEPFDIGSEAKGSLYQDQVTKSRDFFCSENGFSFDQTFESNLPPSTAILEGGSYSRSTTLRVTHTDVIENIECVDAPPSGCDDGVLDPP